MTVRAFGVVALALGLAAPALAAGNPVAGRTVFKAKCGTCHTLKPAGTVAKSANRGPVLTNKHETATRVLRALAGGGTGVMPTFVGVLTTKQINDVVAFVVIASKPGAS